MAHLLLDSLVERAQPSKLLVHPLDEPVLVLDTLVELRDQLSVLALLLEQPRDLLRLLLILGLQVLPFLRELADQALEVLPDLLRLFLLSLLDLLNLVPEHVIPVIIQLELQTLNLLLGYLQLIHETHLADEPARLTTATAGGLRGLLGALFFPMLFRSNYSGIARLLRIQVLV